MLNFRDNSGAKINLIYKPPQKIQDDRKQVYLRYALMRQARNPFEVKWDKWERQYEAWRPNKSDDDWQSNITPPFTTTVVERSLAEIIDQTLQPKIVARGPEDKPKAQLLNYIKNYTWEIGDGDLMAYAAIKQALILGKTIWQEDYWRDRRQVRVLKKFDLEKGIEEYVEKEVDDFDDVYGEYVSLRDFYIDPNARTINRGRYKANDCIRRYILPHDTVMEMFNNEIWNQLDALKYVKAGEGDTNYYQFYQPPQSADKGDLDEVLFYWGRRPDKMILVINDVVIRDGPNPYQHKQLPFAEGSDVHRLDKFYARGEPELLESIQDELTTLRRMRIDRQHMDIWKMFLISNRESLDDDDAVVAPSRFLQVDDTNSVKAVEFSDINPSAYREEELLKQDGREVSGIESPQPASTATQAAIYKESTMRALRLKIWLLSRELFTDIIRLRVPNIVQFYSAPKVERIVGEEKMAQYRTIRTTDVELLTTKQGQLVERQGKGEYFFEVTPEMIIPKYGGYDYKLAGEPTLPVSKPLLQQKVNELMQHPVIQLAIQNGYYDIGKLADKMAEINDFDPEEFKAQKEGQAQQSMVDEETALELANRENEILMKGKRLPFTPFVPRSHTDIHLAFMGSDAFKRGFNQEIMQNFMYHIMGEGRAQEMRGQSTELGNNPRQTRNVGQGIMRGEAKAMMQGRTLGSENLPGGIV